MVMHIPLRTSSKQQQGATNISQENLLEPLPLGTRPPSTNMKLSQSPSRKASILVTSSYALDWIVIFGLGVAAYYMGNVTPNKRPFSLTNPDISFPFTENETVPPLIAAILNTAIPLGIILVICLVLVPGSTVPKGTPQSLIWKRKLWELHAGWLGLGLAVSSAFFITNGMKNMFGKPRPDLLARCEPDLENLTQFIVGGFVGAENNGQLVSAGICTNTDKDKLDDGFRSFPSGHSSSSSAGLIYLSLFLASKFAVTIPFVPLTPGAVDHASHSAFPSRLGRSDTPEDTSDPEAEAEAEEREGADKRLVEPIVREASVNKVVLAVRRQAAAPPIYLLVLALFPFFLSVFIASTRWFDFRHHGFDIMFGYGIGAVTAIYSFRYYHLPISSGAGWAWAPRSADRAFWAGVGRYSYAMHNTRLNGRGGDEEESIGMVRMMRGETSGAERRSSPHGRSSINSS